MVFFSFLGGFILWKPLCTSGFAAISTKRFFLRIFFSLREETVEESFSAMRPESSLKPAGEQKKAKKLPSGGGGTVNQAFFCVLNFV